MWAVCVCVGISVLWWVVLCLCGGDMMMVVGWLCMITDLFLVVVFVVVAGLVVFLRFDLVWFRYYFLVLFG